MKTRRLFIILSLAMGISLVGLIVGLTRPTAALTAVPAKFEELSWEETEVEKRPFVFIPIATGDQAETQFQTMGANGVFVLSSDAIEFQSGDGGMAVRQQFVGESPAVKMEGVDQQTGIFNFFIGNDPEKWQTEIPSYGGVRYVNLYPGIDLVVDSIVDEVTGAAAVRHRFFVAEGADSEQIRWMENGDLVSVDSVNADSQYITVQAGEGNGRHPRVIENKQSVDGIIMSSPSGPNILANPPEILIFSTFLSGDKGSEGHAIAADPFGNSFVAGTNYSSNFPLLNPYQAGFTCSREAPQVGFVASFSINGDLRYATLLGGGCVDVIEDIDVDNDGNAYVTGWTRSINFPTAAPFQSQIDLGCPPDQGWPCGADGFVAKLGPTGSTLPFSSYIGGSDWDYGYGIAWSEAITSVVFTGSASSSDMPVFFGSPSAGSSDAYLGVVSFQSSQPQLAYLSYFGGSSSDSGYGVAAWGNSVYMTGETWSNNLPLVNPLPYNQSPLSAFVTRFTFSSLGGPPSINYVTYLGGAGADIGYAIGTDKDGNAFIAGETGSQDFPVTAGAYDTSPMGASDQRDAFVASLSITGTLRYGTYLGSGGRDGAQDIAVDAWGYAYISGYTRKADFPIANPADAISSCEVNGFIDTAFVAKFNREGSELLFSTCMGGGKSTAGYGVATDGKSGIYVAGITQSSNFPTTSGAFQSVPPTCGFINCNRAFVARFNTLPWTIIYYAAGDNNLSILHERQHPVLEKALANPNVQVILLEDKNPNYGRYDPPDSAYYILSPEEVPIIDGVNRFVQPELNASDPATLETFVVWAKDWADTNRPSQHYALIMDSHGTGITGAMNDWANTEPISEDDPNNAFMSVKDIGAALDSITDNGNDKVDVLYMLACLMGMIEDGYQWRNAADYYIASEALHISEPPEWSSLINVITETTAPISYSISIVDEYYKYRKTTLSIIDDEDPHTLSVADLSKVDALAQATYALGDALSVRMDSISVTLTQILTDVQRFHMTDSDYAIDQNDEYIDIYDFAFRVHNAITDTVVRTGSQNVMDAVSNYIIYERHLNGWLNNYLWSHDNAHGVSIFFPSQPRSFYNGDNLAFVGFTPWYPTAQTIDQAEVSGTGWGDFLVSYVQAVYPDAQDNPNPPPLVPRVTVEDEEAQNYSVFLPMVIR